MSDDNERAERLQDRVDHLAETMLAIAVNHGFLCQCGHSAGCDNLVGVLILSEQDDGSPDSWLTCESCINCAKVNGALPDTTVVYMSEPEP